MHENFLDGSPEDRKISQNRHSRPSRNTSKISSKRDIRGGSRFDSTSNVGSRTDIAIEKNLRFKGDVSFKNSQRSVNKTNGRETGSTNKRNHNQKGYLVESYAVNVKSLDKKPTKKNNITIENNVKFGRKPSIPQHSSIEKKYIPQHQSGRQSSIPQNPSDSISQNKFNIQADNINFDDMPTFGRPDMMTKVHNLSSKLQDKMASIHRIGTDIDRG